MKTYLATVTVIGSAVFHPKVTHKNYQNAGYSPDIKQCIWVAEDHIDMDVSGVEEITQEQAESYLEAWKPVEEEGGEEEE